MRGFLWVMGMPGLKGVFGEVVKTDKEGFESEIAKDERVVVMLGMEGCEQCENFRGEFEELCAGDRKCLEISDVNVGTRFQVEGFPTIAVFQNRGVFFKKFPPEKKTIQDFLDLLDNPSIGSESGNRETWKSARTAFAISDQAESELRREFRVARKFLEISGQAEFVEIAEIVADPEEISVFREGVKEGSWNFRDLAAGRKWGLGGFFSGERIPLFGQVTRETYEMYEYLSIGKYEKFPGAGLVWVCVDPKNRDGQLESNRETVENVARKFRGKFNFVWVDTEIYAEEAERQIGCKMDDRKFLPALIVHIQGERPANLRRHRFNGKDGNFSEEALGNFLHAVERDEAEYFFKSKFPINKNQAVPEISSKELESEKFPIIVGVKVEDEELCGNACRKFISDLSVLRAVYEKPPLNISVRIIDGIENDPPRPNVFWDNVPYLFVLMNGNQTRFPITNDFSLTSMINWLTQTLPSSFSAADFSFMQSEETKRKFVDEISDSTLRVAVQKALASSTAADEDNDDDWLDDLDEEEDAVIGNPPSATTPSPEEKEEEEDWDDLDEL